MSSEHVDRLMKDRASDLPKHFGRFFSEDLRPLDTFRWHLGVEDKLEALNEILERRLAEAVTEFIGSLEFELLASRDELNLVAYLTESGSELFDVVLSVPITELLSRLCKGYDDDADAVSLREDRKHMLKLLKKAVKDTESIEYTSDEEKSP